MTAFKLTHIKWDTEHSSSLPKQVVILLDDSEEVYDTIFADKLSATYDFCVDSLEVEELQGTQLFEL